jgi:hypothetical protein
MAISIGFVGYQQSVVVPITVYPQDDFFRDFFFNLRELTMFIHGLITQDRSVLKLPSNMSRAGMYICSPWKKKTKWIQLERTAQHRRMKSKKNRFNTTEWRKCFSISISYDLMLDVRTSSWIYLNSLDLPFPFHLFYLGIATATSLASLSTKTSVIRIVRISFLRRI